MKSAKQRNPIPRIKESASSIISWDSSFAEVRHRFPREQRDSDLASWEKAIYKSEYDDIINAEDCLLEALDKVIKDEGI